MWQFFKALLIGTIGIVAVLVFSVFACPYGPFGSNPTSEEVESWEIAYSHVLLPGYRSFDGHFIDIDVGVRIFGYRLAVGYEPGKAISAIRTQIQAHKPCFEVESETESELLVRCALPWDPPLSLGFVEYRVLLHRRSGCVTIMNGNFDSPTEQKQYDWFLKKLEQQHRQCSSSAAKEDMRL